MQTTGIRRFVAATITAAALTVGVATPALAQTREHIFLARTSVGLSVDAGEDSVEQNSSAVVSLGKLGRVE